MRKVWVGVILGGVALVAAIGLRARLRTHGAAVVSTLDDAAGPRAAKTLEVAELIYDKAFSNGWEDWGWGVHQVGDGPAKIVFRDYGGIVLHHTELATAFGGFSFRYQAPASFGQFLQVTLGLAAQNDGSFPVVAVKPRHIAPVEGVWNEVLIDWKELNPKQLRFDRILISARTQVGGEFVQLERIFLTPPAPGDDIATANGQLKVSCLGAGHAINDLIYGGSREDWDSGQSAKRVGGNPLTRANWDLGAWNVGKDWYFENQSLKTSMFEELEAVASKQRRLAIVVPTIGWVSKDGGSVGFPRSLFPSQRAFDPYRPEAGDGVAPDGKPLVPPDPTTTSVPAPPELIAQWVRKLVAADTKRGNRTQRFYILDNEPSLWNATHRDVHPKPLDYDELLDRTIRYATAIRGADPDGLIAGPAEWGWLGYHGSAVDREAGNGRAPDRAAHGGVPLVPWYLKKLAEHEKATGTRLLDVLDLHFYPAANGIFDGHAVDPASAALRLRSTRALWDPSYRDESWINEPIGLIPLMKKWVAENYPGRQLMIGEWSFGAEDHISGGLAAAEALGRFGEQGLDSAFFWGEIKREHPVFWAYRAFRNFDGKGGRFLDWSVPTQHSGQVSLFASRDRASGRLVLVLVNHELTKKSLADIALEGCGRVTATQSYAFGPGSKELTPAPSSATPGGVSATLEAASFAVLDLQTER